MQAIEKSGFDTFFRMRMPADMVVRMHAHARARGLSSSAFARFILLEAMDEAEQAIAERKSAA